MSRQTSSWDCRYIAMGRSAKPITGCTVIVPMSDSLAERLARILAEHALKRQYLTAEITVRERQPHDTNGFIQPVISTPEGRAASRRAMEECFPGIMEGP